MAKFFITFLYTVALSIHQGGTDKPCQARPMQGESVVCVCNQDYCDDLDRDQPSDGQFVSYMTSKGGLRFNKTIGNLEARSSDVSTTLTVDPATQYQSILGFGGAVTDAAGINCKNLSDAVQAHLMNSYFGDTGLEYNFIRVPIGGSDFSTQAYAYNELPENDAALSNYTLSQEDINYKLPMIKAAIQAANGRNIKVLASCWSPPLWMKTNGKWTGMSRLKEEYYQTYADYHIKFAQKYKEQGVDLWGLTTTNEPLNGVIGVLTRFNDLGWDSSGMGKYIVNNLGPTIRNSSEFKNLKIIGHDDQRLNLPTWFDPMVKAYPEVLDYIDGIGVHYYTDFFAPASLLTDTVNKYPTKFLLATEACEGSLPWQLTKVVLGSWDRAKSYIQDILTDINHGAAGWIDWNLCLNTQGGPNWAENYVDSPIIVIPENGEFVKQPMFYALGHFSKFVPPGSKRIKIDEKKGFFEKTVSNTAFLTPRNTVVVILYNKDSGSRQVAVNLSNQQAKLTLEGDSITTIEFPYGASA